MASSLNELFAELNAQQPSGMGMYGEPPPGILPLQQLLGAASPLLGMMAGALKLDQSLQTALVGQTIARGGSFFNPPNQANALFNRWQQQAYGDTFAKGGGVAGAVQDAQRAFLENMYLGTGVGPETAKARALNDVTSMFSPMGLASGMMFAPGKMQYASSMQNAGYRMGVASVEPLLNPMSGLSYTPSEAAAMRAGDQQRQNTFRTFATNLATDYYKNPFAFGARNIGELGQTVDYMARSGGLREEDMADANRSGTRQKIAAMGRALDVGKEVFGGELNEVMDKLDALFGGRAGALGEQLERRMLNIKHTLAVTGTSAENFLRMTQASQQYMGVLGVSTEAALPTALAVAQGTGMLQVDNNRFNIENFRSTALQRRAGLTGSQDARRVSAAYMAWMQANNRTDTEANQSEFMAKVGSNTSIGNLANVAGVNERTLLTLAGGEKVTQFIETSTFAPTVLERAEQGKIDAAQKRGLESVLGSDLSKALAAGGLDLATASTADIKKALAATGLSGTALDEKMAQVEGKFGTIARIYGLTTANDPRAFVALEVARNAERNRQTTVKRVKAMATIEETMTSVDRPGQRFGLLGIADAVKEGEGKNLGQLLGSAFGLQTGFSKDEMEQFGNLSRDLVGEDAMKMGEIWKWSRETDLTPEQQKQFRSLIKSGSKEQLQERMNTLFDQTKRGVQSKVLEGIDLWGKNDKGKTLSAAEQQKLIREQSAKKALEDTGLMASAASDAYEYANAPLLKGDTYQEKLRYATENDVEGVSAEQKARALEENKRNLGAFEMKPNEPGQVDLQQVLAELAEYIRDLVAKGITINQGPAGAGG